jgi:hypothetical protein
MPPRKSPDRDFFYWEKSARKDANFHNPILDEGDHEAAKKISDKVVQRLGIKPPKKSTRRDSSSPEE